MLGLNTKQRSLGRAYPPTDTLYIYTDYLIVILTSMFLITIFPMLFLYLEILSSVSFAYQNLNRFLKPRSNPISSEKSSLSAPRLRTSLPFHNQ